MYRYTVLHLQLSLGLGLEVPRDHLWAVLVLVLLTSLGLFSRIRQVAPIYTPSDTWLLWPT